MITPQQRQAAITYLLDAIQPDRLQEIYRLMQQPGWPSQYHLGAGLLVRNLLRQEFEWDDQTLDAEWSGLITEAVRRYRKGKPNGAMA